MLHVQENRRTKASALSRNHAHIVPCASDRRSTSSLKTLFSRHPEQTEQRRCGAVKRKSVLRLFAEVMADPLGAAWIRPIDYREVVKGSAYEAVGHRRISPASETGGSRRATSCQTDSLLVRSRPRIINKSYGQFRVRLSGHCVAPIIGIAKAPITYYRIC